MSGPWAETRPLHIRTSLDVSLWPLELWTDGGEAHIECAECGTGGLLVAKAKAKPFVIAELTAQVEAHIAQCPRADGRS
jgi:hypothetical protein